MCSDCAFCKPKLSYLGFRDWCRKYKQFHTVKCIAQVTGAAASSPRPVD